MSSKLWRHLDPVNKLDGIPLSVVHGYLASIIPAYANSGLTPVRITGVLGEYPLRRTMAVIRLRQPGGAIIDTEIPPEAVHDWLDANVPDWRQNRLTRSDQLNTDKRVYFTDLI